MKTKLWRRKTLWIIIFILCCVGTNNITSQSADAAGAANTTKNVYTTSQINSIQSLAQKNYTVLIYMIGSDLESENSAASNDIAEITTALQQSAGKISDYANIVVEYGGSTKWHNPILKNADSLHGRFELTKNGIENLTTLQPKSMGDPDTLQAFLSFGITRYPADNYILIFWDHGDGPVLGYGCDALYKDDSLTMGVFDCHAADILETIFLTKSGKPAKTRDDCTSSNVSRLSVWIIMVMTNSEAVMYQKLWI